MEQWNIGKMSKNRILILLIVFVCLFNSGCDTFTKYKKGETELKLAYVMAPGGTVHLGALKFAEFVNEKSGGRIKVKIYPNGQLGNDRELSEALIIGSIDMVLTGPAVIGWYAPEYGATETPFMFRSYEHVEKMLKGPIGKEIEQLMIKRRGIHFISYWLRGPRYLTTTKTIVRAPEDLSGLKLRVPELPTYIRSWKIFGANPTPLPYSDMFMALKQGVVDGQENPLEVIYTSHLYEAQKYVMETRHLLSFYILETSDHFFSKFSPENQKLILEAADEAKRYQDLMMFEYEEKYTKFLQENGMEFIEVDRQAFEEIALNKLPPYFKDKWVPDLFERIWNIK